MYYKISSIMLNGSQKTSNASEIFIAQPDEHKEQLAGRLFFLSEIESHKSKALKIVNFLVNSINYNYYQSEKILLREQISDLKVEHIFETALANVNKDLLDFLHREKINISPHAFNVTAGVIYENHLYLSSIGKNKNLLIYPSENQKYKISDIGNNKNTSPSLTKIFSDVISGPLPEGGYFLLANEALTEHLSHNQILETVTKLPPAGAASHIENIISQINVPVNFLGIIIKNTTHSQETQQEEDKKRSPSHLLDIDRTKNETEEIMKPAGAINLRNLTQKIPSRQKKETPPPTSSKTAVKKKNYFLLVKKIMRVLQSGLRSLARHTKNLIAVFTKKFSSKPSSSGSDRDQQETLSPPKEQGTSPSSKTVSLFSKGGDLLFRNKKIILAGAIILLLAFGLSTFYTSSEKNYKQEKIEINNAISQIEKNQNKIDANLLYNNDNNAQQLLQKNEELLNELEEKLQNVPINKEEKYQTLTSKAQEQRRKLRDVVTLSEALKVADLSFEEQTPSTPMIKFQQNIYVGANSEIYKIDLGNKENSPLNDQNIEIPSLRSPVISDDNIYYWVDPGLLKINTKTSEIEPLSLELPDQAEIETMGAFENNIYLLDTQNNQIHKYFPSYNDFTNHETWLQKEQELEKITDLAIDGYIYTLSSTGEVNRYLRGQKQEFELSTITPELKKASRIRVSPEMGEGNIYILDSSNNRITVYTKQGEFLRQYQDSDFSDIKDLYVDEANNKFYFVNGATLYSHPLKKDSEE